MAVSKFMIGKNRMDSFRNIGLIGRMGSVQVVETLRRLKKYLASEGYYLILEENIGALNTRLRLLALCSPWTSLVTGYK